MTMNNTANETTQENIKEILWQAEKDREWDEYLQTAQQEARLKGMRKPEEKQ